MLIFFKELKITSLVFKAGLYTAIFCKYKYTPILFNGYLVIIVKTKW